MDINIWPTYLNFYCHFRRKSMAEKYPTYLYLWFRHLSKLLQFFLTALLTIVEMESHFSLNSWPWFQLWKMKCISWIALIQQRSSSWYSSWIPVHRQILDWVDNMVSFPSQYGWWWQWSEFSSRGVIGTGCSGCTIFFMQGGEMGEMGQMMADDGRLYCFVLWFLNVFFFYLVWLISLWCSL